jgi:hypothetical protein
VNPSPGLPMTALATRFIDVFIVALIITAFT